MSKTVAISFSGLPRIVPTALESWKRLIHQYNADVFIHTWDDNNYSGQKLCEIFKPVLSIIDQPAELDTSKYKERLIHSDPYSVLSMWTSINKSINLTTSYDCYDIIIRGRFDVAFDNLELTFSDSIKIPGKPPEKYNYNGSTYNGWHDMIAYGDQNSMNLYCSTLNFIPELYDNNGPFFSEYFLSTTLKILNANVIHQNIWADIVRY